MDFQSISVGQIENLEQHAKDLFRGAVEIKFTENIGGVGVAHEIRAQIRLTHKASATVQSLEEALFRRFLHLLVHASQLLEQETLESLRQQEKAINEQAERERWKSVL